MNKIIFATSNAGKMKEIREILKDLNVELMWILWRMEKPSKKMH